MSASDSYPHAVSKAKVVGDFNGDGYPDIYFGTEAVLSGDGGSYTPMSIDELYVDAGVVKAAAWGDVNGDGLHTCACIHAHI